MRIELSGPTLKKLAEAQRSELSRKTYDKLSGDAGKAEGDTRISASHAGLGGIPPTLETLAGVACHRIIR